MKVRWLVNENFPAPSIVVLRAAGHDVLSIAESHSGDDDTEALALAREAGRWQAVEKALEAWLCICGAGSYAVAG